MLKTKRNYKIFAVKDECALTDAYKWENIQIKILSEIVLTSTLTYFIFCKGPKHYFFCHAHIKFAKETHEYIAIAEFFNICK